MLFAKQLAFQTSKSSRDNSIYNHRFLRSIRRWLGNPGRGKFYSPRDSLYLLHRRALQTEWDRVPMEGQVWSLRESRVAV